MGFRFRKSIKFPGGFRVNASSSGLGYSYGAKGYRISKTAKGTTRKTVSIPGTGISHVEEFETQSSAPRGSRPAGQRPLKKRHGCLTQIVLVFVVLIVIGVIGSAFSDLKEKSQDVRQIPTNNEVVSPSLSPSPSKENEKRPSLEELQNQATTYLSEQFQLDLVDMQDRNIRYDIRVTAAGISDRADQTEAPENWDDFLLDFISAQARTSSEINRPIMLYLVDTNDEVMLSCTNGRIRENRYKEESEPISPSDQPSDRRVWVTDSGSKYHYSSSCSGMNNPHSIPISEAISKGYTACDKCA